MAKVLKAYTKVNDTVNKSLKKVQEKPWAEPLGQVLGVTGQIVETCGNFIPGAGLIGGALSFGASLLNPEPTLEDLKKQMTQMENSLKDISADNKFMRDYVQNGMRKLQERIDNPPDEIRSDFEKVKLEMIEMMKGIREDNDSFADEILGMKDIISKTFDLVTDINYKVMHISARYVEYLTLDQFFRNALKV